MDKFTLKREDTVLFVIDIQDKLLAAMKYKDQVIDKNKILISAAKEMDFPIIATEQYPKGLGRTVDELLKLMDEKDIFAKNSFTAYTDEVKESLKSLGRKKILITGMETHICVFQTTRDLINDGYQVYLVKDAVTSRAKSNYLNGLDLCQSLGAVVTNTETAVYDLLKVSGTPEFKAMLKVIK
ncbi:MAG TPA: isochorismatase family protein [Clostridiales bacterium]|nr:isochorismatase family protein [Clostridiales bacterium]